MSLDMAIKCFAKAQAFLTVCTGANGQRIALTARRLEKCRTAAGSGEQEKEDSESQGMQLVGGDGNLERMVLSKP